MILSLSVFVSASENCADSDGGLNYYVKGNLSLNGNYVDSDWCSGSTLNEKYCISNSTSGTKSYICQWGCVDGACLDSDPWKNYIYQANYLSFDFSSFANTTQAGNNYQEYQAHYNSDSFKEEVSVLVFSSNQDANDFFDDFASNVDLVFEKGVGRFLDSNREATAWTSNNKVIFVVGSSSESIENLYLQKYPSTIQSDLQNSSKACVISNLGYRKAGYYCSEDGFVLQKEADASCENNFECSTNLCIDNQCINGNLWQKFLAWLRRLFG